MLGSEASTRKVFGLNIVFTYLRSFVFNSLELPMTWTFFQPFASSALFTTSLTERTLGTRLLYSLIYHHVPLSLGASCVTREKTAKKNGRVGISPAHFVFVSRTADWTKRITHYGRTTDKEKEGLLVVYHHVYVSGLPLAIRHVLSPVKTPGNETPVWICLQYGDVRCCSFLVRYCSCFSARFHIRGNFTLLSLPPLEVSCHLPGPKREFFLR